MLYWLRISFIIWCAELVSVPYPICFGIPECKIVSKIPHKKLDFAKLIPGNSTTYIYNDETTYYQAYRDAYYGFTWKKGGWDCMRHYEILASGCMPYFTNLALSSANTMFRLPRELITDAMYLQGVAPGRIDFTKFNSQKYYEILNKTIEYARTYLTTRSIAQYVLDIMKYSGQGKILFLGEQVQPLDYMRDTILIGLKEILSDRVIDYPRIDHIYKDYLGDTKKLYGKGFSCTKIIVDDFSIDRSNIEARIRNKEFELIIYGYVHHGRSFYETVLQNYPVGKIAYICGEDAHQCEYVNLPNFFLREYESYTVK